MLDDSLLDAADRLASADRDGLLRATATAGAQVRGAVALTADADVDGYLGGMLPRAVLVAGEAAAEPAAELFVTLAAGTDAAAPVVRATGPELPVWLGAADLLLLAAHTGGEERVLLLADAALHRGVPIVAAGPSPSPLDEVCARGRAAYIPVPPGRPARAALWGLLTPLLVTGQLVGLLGVDRADLSDLSGAADALDALAERCAPGNETFSNQAKALALELGAALPVVWGTSALAGAAAARLAAQLAGNAITPASWGTLPAAAHLFGGLLDDPEFGGTEDLFRDRVDEPEPRRARLVLLRDRAAEPDPHSLAERLVEVLDRRGVPVTELAADGDGPATRLASLVGLLDFASIYVGLALGIDPSGVRTGQAAP